jgi:hypothetical protein
MKRLFYLVSLITSVFFFNSCTEEDPAKGISADETFTNKAIIEGYAYLSTNKSSTEAIKYVPEGTLLSFAIAYGNDYGGLGVPGSNGRYVKTTTVGANGRYSIELPTRADGVVSTVTISGAQVLLTVTTDDGKSRDQVFSLTPVTQEIISDFTYLKKLEYEEEAILQNSETWKEGTYRIKLEYSDGMRKLSVPQDTEVRVTVAKSEFVPERTNDLVFIKKVGRNGLLEIKLPAPTLLDGGLTFAWELIFVAEAITRYTSDNDGNPIPVYDDYVFGFAPFSNYIQSVIYGGKTVEKSPIEAQRGEQLTFN